MEHMDIGGLIYLLNSAGAALAAANERIAQLSNEIQVLRTQLTDPEMTRQT